MVALSTNGSMMELHTGGPCNRRFYQTDSQLGRFVGSWRIQIADAESE